MIFRKSTATSNGSGPEKDDLAGASLRADPPSWHESAFRLSELFVGEALPVVPLIAHGSGQCRCSQVRRGDCGGSQIPPDQRDMRELLRGEDGVDVHADQRAEIARRRERFLQFSDQLVLVPNWRLVASLRGVDRQRSDPIRLGKQTCGQWI